MIKKLISNLEGNELKKFLLLASIFLFLIGVYWLLRSVKDSILASTVGITYQPVAKMLSLCFLIPLILFYSKLVDIFKKHHLFYLIAGVYAVFFVVAAYLLGRPGIGLSNTVEDPSRFIGWACYLGIESFGSLMVSLFWSLVASSTSPESAKKGYPLIIFGAQFGSITGPLLVTKADTIGVNGLVYMGSVGIVMTMILLSVYIKAVPAELTGLDEPTTKAGEKKTGMLEGLKLLFRFKYVAGIFCVATFYEVVGTILDFQMKLLARQAYTSPETFAHFMGIFGIGCNTLTLLFSLVGTGFIMKKWGLTFCIVLFPIAVGCVVIFVYFFSSMWVLFGGLIVIRCFTYALNNPAKEIMYIPTSKDIKFKTKGWIDMFGARSMKATGSAINNVFKGSTQSLLLYGTLISLCIVFVWIFIASFVGKTFESLTKENKILQ
jgi:AAA family ATP:ADP antiporter